VKSSCVKNILKSSTKRRLKNAAALEPFFLKINLENDQLLLWKKLKNYA